MKPFLEKLTEEILSKHKNVLANTCIVFPSRRASVYFKKYLSEKIDSPVWSPKTYSIQDFIDEYSPYVIADKITLIFELFEVYKKFGEEQSFEKFFSWGDMMLNDFDEADKYLVDAGYLFRVIKEQKDIEEQFALDEFEMEGFKEFWNMFLGKKQNELKETQRDFIKTWQILGKVYNTFRSKLQEQGICYEGMAYRKIYNDIKSDKLKLNCSKIIFAGFNALNRAEEGIIRLLLKNKIAEVYWDADEYYYSNKNHEAGKFLRENEVRLGLDNFHWIENNISKSSKEINIIGVASNSGQAKIAGVEISKIIADNPDNINNTAVVLPDENFMMPMLNALPDNIDSFNVTMGYPMKSSPLYSLIHTLKNLFHNKKGEGENARFYHKDVIELMLHPYFKFSDMATIYDYVSKIKKNNFVYIYKSKLPENSLLTEPFEDINTSIECIDYLYKLYSVIIPNLNSQFDRENANVFLKQLNLFNDVFAKYKVEIDSNLFLNLFLDALALIKIPFEGESLKGLQIMGTLETRCLDFENVIILSMNEGILPKGYSQSSFIPFRLRKAFKMNTFEDDDSIYSYYFYRILQRTKKIFLLYNTEPDNFSKGELSRFVMQVDKEMKFDNKVKHQVLQADSLLPAIKKITIEKDKSVMDLLKSQKGFSPSSMNIYINCKLQYYFKNIARLKEEDTIEEFFSGGTLGDILHKIMENLYTKYKKGFVKEKDFDKLKTRLNNEFETILQKAFKDINKEREFTAELEGKNLLYKSVIKKLVENILDYDKLNAPIKIISLEKEMFKTIPTDFGGAQMFGTIDRVDEVAGKLRIVDYKTGKPMNNISPERNNKEQYFEKIFKTSDYKELFQTYYYSLLYLNKYPDADLEIIIYFLKAFSGGVTKPLEDIPDIKEYLDTFKEKLSELFNEMLNPEIPFSQTENEENCLYCPYKSICYRD